MKDLVITDKLVEVIANKLWEHYGQPNMGYKRKTIDKAVRYYLAEVIDKITDPDSGSDYIFGAYHPVMSNYWDKALQKAAGEDR